MNDLKNTLGRNLVITDREPRNDEEALVIKCGNAFAPSHPTTELCFKLMEQAFSRRAINSILDVGCGSGVLGLVGLKLCDVPFNDHLMVDLPPSVSSTFGAAEFFPDGGAMR